MTFEMPRLTFFFPGNVVHLWKHDKEHRQYYIAQSLLFTVPQVGHGIHLRGKRIYAEIKNHRNLHSISTQKSEFLLRDRISIKTILDNQKFLVFLYHSGVKVCATANAVTKVKSTHF